VGEAPVAAAAPGEGRWGELERASHSTALRLVLRTQPRSPLVPHGTTEMEPIGRPGSTGSLMERRLSNFSL